MICNQLLALSDIQNLVKTITNACIIWEMKASLWTTTSLTLAMHNLTLCFLCFHLVYRCVPNVEWGMVLLVDCDKDCLDAQWGILILFRNQNVEEFWFVFSEGLWICNLENHFSWSLLNNDCSIQQIMMNGFGVGGSPMIWLHVSLST